MSRLAFYCSIWRSAVLLLAVGLHKMLIPVDSASFHNKQCTNISYVIITMTGLIYNTYTNQ